MPRIKEQNYVALVDLEMLVKSIKNRTTCGAFIHEEYDLRIGNL